MEDRGQPAFTREQLLEIRNKHYAKEQKVYIDQIIKSIIRDVKEVAKTQTNFYKIYYIKDKLFTSIPDLYTRLYTCFPDSYVTLKCKDDTSLFREKMKAVEIKIDWTTVCKSVNIDTVMEYIKTLSLPKEQREQSGQSEQSEQSEEQV